MGTETIPQGSSTPEAACRRGSALARLPTLVGLSLCSLACGYLGAWLQVRPFAAELATRPPVIVLDARETLRGLPAERVGAAIARERALARRLAERGVLVLDSQAVVEAPAGLVVRIAADEPAQAVRP